MLPPEWVVEAQVPARVSVVGRKEDRHRKVLPHRRYAIHDRIHVRAIAIPHAIPRVYGLRMGARRETLPKDSAASQRRIEDRIQRSYCGPSPRHLSILFHACGKAMGCCAAIVVLCTVHQRRELCNFSRHEEIWNREHHFPCVGWRLSERSRGLWLPQFDAVSTQHAGEFGLQRWLKAHQRQSYVALIPADHCHRTFDRNWIAGQPQQVAA